MDYLNDEFPIASEAEGHDLAGRCRRLGDYDCDGYRVGYICDDTVYRSREEAIINRYVGRVHDAVDGHLSGGPMPDVFAMAETLVPEELRSTALRCAKEACLFWVRMRAVRSESRPGYDLPEFADPELAWGGYAPDRA